VEAKEEKGLDLVVKVEKVSDLEVPRDPEEREDCQLDVQR